VRRLAALVQAEADGDTEARDALRRQALAWRDLPEAGGPAELETPAARLRELGQIVLGVLDGELPAGQARERLALAGQSMGEYLLAPVPALRAWLERRAGLGDRHG
jgi:hypothetical protein